MILNYLRKLLHKMNGLNGTIARLDILHGKLDSIATTLIEVSSNRIDLSPNSINSISTPQISSKTSIESKTKKIDTQNDRRDDERTKKQPVVIHMQPGEAIRIAFIVQHPSVWTSWRSVWRATLNNSRFLSKVVLANFKHPLSTEAVMYDNMKKFLIDENIPFCTAESFDISSFRPHITFVQNPYEDTRQERFRIDQLKKAGTRIAYIPYGLEMGGGAWNIAAQFDSLLHRSAWRIFARSERHKKMFGKYCHAGNDHVIVVGHPKFDSQNFRYCNDKSKNTIKKIDGRKVILWTPHFSVGEPPAWSTFKLYGEYILSEMQRRRDLFLLLRPHPMFFQTMQQFKLWDTAGEENFRQMIKDSDNLYLDESSEHHEAFLISDALMTDVGSFLLEYLPTGKPLLYLHHPNGLGMNDDQELVRYLYTASEPNDISEFIEMVALGVDHGKSERENALSEFIYGLGSNIGESICQHIYSSISEGDSYSPKLSEKETLAQENSEIYWQGSSCTYLAPTNYYDRKEVILGDLLERLTRFHNVIDIGCGDGRFTFILANYADEVIGYDISPKLVEKAKASSIFINSGATRFETQKVDNILPTEKYDLVSCMGVTSCIIEDNKFLRILDKFRMLSKHGGRLILIDTLSLERERIVSEQSGYIAKYRNIGDYLNLIRRRGFRLDEDIIIAEDSEKKLINKLFLFTFYDSFLS